MRNLHSHVSPVGFPFFFTSMIKTELKKAIITTHIRPVKQYIIKVVPFNEREDVKFELGDGIVVLLSARVFVDDAGTIAIAVSSFCEHSILGMG